MAKLDRTEEAETLHRRVLAIRNASSGWRSTISGLAATRLAGVITQRGRFAEADSIYRWALAVIRAERPDDHIDMRRVYAGLAALYDARGKPDSAAAYWRLVGPREDLRAVWP